MQIRLALESDIPVIGEILKRNFDEVISKDHSLEVVEKFKAHNTEESLLHQLSWKRVYVAGINNQVIGTGAFANLTYTDQTNFHVPSTRGAVAFYREFGFTVDEIQNDTTD